MQLPCWQVLQGDPEGALSSFLKPSQIPLNTLNSTIKLALATVSVAGTAVAIIGQAPAAFAGPGLESASNNSYTAGAAYNLNFEQSFSATGSSTSVVTPFAITTGALPAGGTAPAPVVTQTGLIEGNAGTSTLTAAFNPIGVVGGTATANKPSFAVQAGVIPFGGQAGTGGVTTAAATSGIFTTPPAVVLNQGTTGAAGITLTGSGTANGIIAASVNGTDIGASQVQGGFTQNLSVITSLSAF